MQNDMDLERLKKALSKLSPEERKMLMSEASPDDHTDSSTIPRSEDETTEPEGVDSEQKLSHSDLAAQLSLETERISVRHLLSCFPWVVIAFSILLGLTVALKYIWEQLMSL